MSDRGGDIETSLERLKNASAEGKTSCSKHSSQDR